MDSAPRAWGFWTKVKLRALERYLKEFTKASKNKAPSTLYLDLFAGVANDVLRDEDEIIAGSTIRALKTEPKFTKLVLFELADKVKQLENRLQEQFPGDQRYEIVPGDCNQTISQALEALKPEEQGNDYSKSPSFAFIDPCGLNIHWETLVKIAKFKEDTILSGISETKTEMWILFSDPTIFRVSGLKTTERITQMYGTDDWEAIRKQRKSGKIKPPEARKLYVDLFRNRLQSSLGYKYTIAMYFVRKRNMPMYTMIFATDHIKAGKPIMESVYKNSRNDLLEILEAKEQSKGQLQLSDNMTMSKINWNDYPDDFMLADKYPHLPDWLDQAANEK